MWLFLTGFEAHAGLAAVGKLARELGGCETQGNLVPSGDALERHPRVHPRVFCGTPIVRNSIS